jgi:lysophospholipase L1-like esterase
MKYILSLLIFFYAQSSFADYVMIGDSLFVHRNQEIKSQIESSQHIKITNHAVTGHWFKQIVKQYKQANIKVDDTIIMDGGGNDIMGNAGNCRNKMNKNCINQVDEISIQFKELLDLMLNNMIFKVYYLSCYHTTGWQGSGYDQVIDYGVEKMKSICADHLVQCIFIDTRSKMTGDVFEWDGVHPNQRGVRILSDLILEALNAK